MQLAKINLNLLRVFAVFTKAVFQVELRTHPCLS